MSDEKTLTFYLEPEMRARAEAGKITFVNKVVAAFKSCGFRSAFRETQILSCLGQRKGGAIRCSTWTIRFIRAH
jgi:hypothetical protein